jgi:hypothetical protein
VAGRAPDAEEEAMTENFTAVSGPIGSLLIGLAAALLLLNGRINGIVGGLLVPKS